MYYPWQTLQWQQLMTAKAASRLPHALLFAGIAGTGKAHFAHCFVSTLLCTANDNYSCKQCHSCRLVEGRTHPNVLWLEPEKPGQAIKIDQIRAVTEFVEQSSLQGELRFVIINPADVMNTNAANALLKTLEEPANGAMLILISNETRHILPTILSRCQRIVFAAPDKKLALAWLNAQAAVENPDVLLRLTKGAPLAALNLLQDDVLKQRLQLYQALLAGQNTDPIRTAALCTDYQPIVFIDFMLTWVMDLLALQLGISHEDLINCDYANSLETLKKQTRVALINQFMNYLQKLRGQLASGFNLNKQLLMETVLIRWLDCFGAEA